MLRRPRAISGPRLTGTRARRWCRALSAEHGLTDAFRHLHPAAAEYSWVGRIGDGYRCDHAFCSAILTPASTCTNPRTDGLSDHSALTAGLTAQPPPGLAVSDPATATAPATLF